MGGLKACCVDVVFVFSNLMHGIVFNWYPSYPLLKTISKRSRGKPLTIDHYWLFLFPHQQAFILIPNSYCPSRCKISQPYVEMGTQIWLLNDPVNKPYIYQPFVTPEMNDHNPMGGGSVWKQIQIYLGSHLLSRTYKSTHLSVTTD